MGYINFAVLGKKIIHMYTACIIKYNNPGERNRGIPHEVYVAPARLRDTACVRAN